MLVYFYTPKLGKLYANFSKEFITILDIRTVRHALLLRGRNAVIVEAVRWLTKSQQVRNALQYV
jgi:hypothetical protein